MQAIKNGIKCTFRTPGKTLLFLLILTVISALMAVSFSVYGAVRGYIGDCDEYFHTIAELEYMGKDYPDSFVYDEAVAEAVAENRAVLEKLVGHEAVLAFEPARSYIAVSDSIRRWDAGVYDPNTAVLDVHIIGYDKLQYVYTATVTGALYSRRDYSGRLMLMNADLNPDGSPALDPGKDYIVVGRFFNSSSSNLWFSQSEFTFIENGGTVTLSEPILKEECVEGDVYHRAANEMHFRNDSVRVTYTSSVGDLYPFHQEVLKLSSGRFFTEEEYESKARVCIVSERISGMLGLSLGDKISFDVYGSDGDVYSCSGLQKKDGGDYEIIGIHAEAESFPYRVFMPDRDAANSAIANVNGYTLGQFRLKNDKAASFLEDSAELFERGFRVNVYDQGYSAATEPMRELLFISVIFLAVCLLLAVCALALQSRLFVARQREAALTMHAIGSGKGHIFAYFLSSTTLLAALAAVLGGIAAKLLEGKVFGILNDYALQFEGVDSRFSSGSVALTRALEFSPSSNLCAYLAAALTLIVGAAVLTLIFSAAALRERKTARKKHAETKIAVKRSAHTSKLSGFLKYSLLSLRRGKIRSLAVVVMGVVAALFFLRLTSSVDGYRDQLEAYTNDAEISGYATDYYGHRISGLILRSQPIVRLCSGGLVQDTCVTTNFGHIMFIYQVGDSYVDFVSPSSSFAYESLYQKVWSCPAWSGVSSVENSPLFHYSRSGAVEWLEGWSDEAFSRAEVKTIDWRVWSYRLHDYVTVPVEYYSGPSVCALSRDVMEELGIKLGDKLTAINAFDYNGDPLLSFVDELTVVACYTSATKSTEVYSPVSYVPLFRVEDAIPPDDVYSQIEDGFVWINGSKVSIEEYYKSLEMGIIPGLTYSSFTFRLTDASRLDELRDALIESGFTHIRSTDRIANPVIIEDEIFLNTVHSMERQIQYVTVLYTALYVLAGIIGFVLAWLMTLSRRKEIAVMRALGTPPVRIILNFLFEQMLLILAGLAVGLAAPLLFRVTPTRPAIMLCAAFFAVWSISSLVCLIVSLMKRARAALTEPE